MRVYRRESEVGRLEGKGLQFQFVSLKFMRRGEETVLRKGES